jgi:alpha-tubulin suppressor-like RCC1 family protein
LLLSSIFQFQHPLPRLDLAESRSGIQVLLDAYLTLDQNLDSRRSSSAGLSGGFAVNTITSRAFGQAHLCAAALLIAVIGCSDVTDQQSPELQSEDGPALATTTAALSFTQLSGGGRHTCGVTTDHRVYCWGFNFYGQLGDGTNTQRLRPVLVSGSLSFRSVSAGSLHTCGVTTTNQAYCWGLGADGSLGNGATSDHSTPVAVAGGHLFRTVESGDAHTCGLTVSDNRAWCWGVNDRGVLGNGTATRTSSPVAVSGGRAFREVSAGLTHTCGVTTTDQAYCWGSDSAGQLGDDHPAPFQTTPVAVAGTRLFDQISAGWSFTCAITTSHRAFCWGSGKRGQIGDGHPFQRNTPRAVAGGLAFERVTAGEAHACGETTDNRAYCWGSGGIGDGTGTPRLSPVVVSGGRFYAQLSAGDNHTCGRTGSNVAFCWGNNDYGQLGDGTTTTRLAPVRVVGPS